ncbi:ornithine carbamoyltransferase [Flavobacterium enshiense DK69]|uniref:N-succinylornithine carbamoyltransferase n=1 Tax=Flavobacterium enshiense DK69 TaxID=1107311 RepID=V6S2D4_9FLAO|nr:N-acetylornithine carbamoyltransferase [Flavobacterium enshiense]ESU20417.1 ornithine carbamoyltransferase [Flavobacterium enshiense DK69]KGO95778.1 acetylornithine carbamoyltransferase [Flavobacterium enshiense DK69]
MKHFTSVNDIQDLNELLLLAKQIKSAPYENKTLGENKTIGLLFFNPSLRTRLSTQKAATNLGMNTIVMNLNNDGWNLEFEDGAIMNGNKAEHIKEAAQVVSQYCDIIAIRSFPTLTDKVQDEEEQVINSFKKYASVPVISLEGATEHPLQAVADILTISEFKTKKRPKVVLTWAPHPKALPHAVPNSFVKMMQLSDVDFVITHPKGYELNPEITNKSKIIHDQEEAFKDADFIYAKNWSNYNDYGQITSQDTSWTVTSEKMQLTNNAKFMHCLPVRRNQIVTDAVLDGENSIVIDQANNRTFATQAILTQILENHGK